MEKFKKIKGLKVGGEPAKKKSEKQDQKPNHLVKDPIFRKIDKKSRTFSWYHFFSLIYIFSIIFTIINFKKISLLIVDNFLEFIKIIFIVFLAIIFLNRRRGASEGGVFKWLLIMKLFEKEDD